MERERIDGEDYVVCSAMANPKETDFVWSLKSDNDTLEQIAVARNGKSYIRLDTSVTNFRTYVCVANNSIGHSSPCDRDVPGMPRSHAFLRFPFGTRLMIYLDLEVEILCIRVVYRNELLVVVFLLLFGFGLLFQSLIFYSVYTSINKDDRFRLNLIQDKCNKCKCKLI